ncbi:MAG: HlyD family type I secretion periplasmic adaptor subunit, partial [Campylobacteraceae bacterium]|nr:HlyD family type I secretion periplasmic adaptor subunit [Campylobacteraceae bacterium]
MSFFHTKDKHEFKPLLIEIEDRGINPLGRSLLWIIIAIIAFGSIWLYFAKIAVVISATGKVIPNGEIKILQPMQSGVISKIYVKAGDLIQKDEVLMEIDRSVTKSDLKSKKENLKLLKLEIKRLLALINDKAFKIPLSFKNAPIANTQTKFYNSIKSAQKEQIKSLNEQLKQINEQTNGTKVEEQRLKQLEKNMASKVKRLQTVKDIIAKKDLEVAKNNLFSLGKQALEKEHGVLQFKAKLNEIKRKKRVVEKEYKNRLYDKLTKKREKANELKVQIEAISFKDKKQQLKSPVEGYLGKLMMHTIGGVVTPAQKLISIIPKNAPLIIKAIVLNKDIGFVKKDMKSIIKVYTYNFQKYGLIDGIVTYVSNDAIEDKKLGL